MNKFLTFLTEFAANVLAKYLYSIAKDHLVKYKDNKSIEKVKEAKTESEFDDAAKNIANRF